ncbi:hypothetical protein HDV06_004215 [Boothiomyces sp. JEL0866]|nr:hypothetical protein HDV06_004215 [Boothiomyces sp. JEL0866]
MNTSVSEEVHHGNPPHPDFAPKRTIVFPVDGSEHSKNTINWAIENLLTDQDQAVLMNVRSGVLSIFNVNMGYPYAPTVYPEETVHRVEDAEKAASHELLLNYSKMLVAKKIHTKAIALRGEARSELVTTINSLKPSIVVVGSRGLSNIATSLLGSVSNYLLHNCECPVLILPAKNSQPVIIPSEEVVVEEPRISQPTLQEENIQELSELIKSEHIEDILEPEEEEDADIEEFTDEALFPGYQFESNILDSQPSLEENILDPFANNSILSYEQKVLEKYSKTGTLSSFKGIKEIKKFRTKMAVKTNIQQLQDKISEMERVIKQTETELQNCKEQHQRSKFDMEKIVIEIEDMLNEKGIRSPFNSDPVVIPPDPHLMLKPRYRLLKDHYFIHDEFINLSQQKQPQLEVRLLELREELQTLQSEESLRQSTLKSIIVQDKEEFLETSIVAKHRNLQYQEKQRGLEREKKLLLLQEQKQVQKEKEEEVKLLESQKKSSAVMHKYIQQSYQKQKKEDERLEEERKQYQEKKQLAIVALTQHLQDIKADLERRRRKAGSKPRKSIHSNEIFSMQETRNLIANQKLEKQRRKEEKLQKSETAKFEILENILKQEARLERQSLCAKGLLKISKKKKTIVEADIAPPAEVEEEASPAEVKERQPRRPIPLIKLRPALPPIKNSIQSTFSLTKPFEFEPESLIFENLIPGCVVKRKVRMINTTACLNTFKLVQIPEELDSSLSVKYKLIGKHTAGSQTWIDITLKTTKDILQTPSIHSLKFRAAVGGDFEYDIHINPAKCSPNVHSVGGENISTIKYTSEGQISKKGIKSTLLEKIQPSNSNEIIVDFGNCYLGSSKSMWVKIQNTGYYATNYFVKTNHGNDEQHSSDSDLIDYQNYKISKTKGHLDSLGYAVIPINFEPEFDEDSQICEDEVAAYQSGTKKTAKFDVVFSENVPKITITCVGLAKYLPLSINRNLVDLQWCLDSVDYQDFIILRNAHSTSLKFQILAYDENVKYSNGWLIIPDIGQVQIAPISGFIQPFEPFKVWLKINFLQKVNETHENGTVPVQIPLCVTYTDSTNQKENQILFKVVAKITNRDIEVKSIDHMDDLDFGTVSVLERKELDITIRNCSKFPQHVRFFSKSNTFKLKPNTNDHLHDTFFLSPLETIHRSVWFDPSESKDYFENIQFKNTWGKSFKIRCIGKGFQPDAKFQKSEVELPKISFGCEAIKRIQLNRRKLEEGEETSYLEYEFHQPVMLEISGETIINPDAPSHNVDLNNPSSYALGEKDGQILQILPNKGKFREQSCVGVDVLASIPHIIPDPPKKAVPEKVEEVVAVPVPTKGKENKGKSKTAAQKAPVEEVISAPVVEEPLLPTKTPFQIKLFSTKSPVIHWLIPCTLKTVKTDEQQLNALLSSTQKLDNEIRECKIYIKVTTPICTSTFELLEQTGTKCDFGYNAVGRKAVRSIIFKNISGSEIQLKMKGLHPNGPFTLIKAIRPAKPDEKIVVKFSFKPKEAYRYAQNLEFYHQNTSIAVKLVGEAIIPKIQIEPGMQIDMGDVCVGDNTSQTVKISNNSEIALTTVFTFVSYIQPLSVGSLNFDKHSAFSYNLPNRVTIPAKSSYDLLVKFQPDREYDNYHDYLVILCKELEAPLKVKLAGRGWHVTSIVSGYEPHPPTFKAYSWSCYPKLEYDLAFDRLTLGEEKKEELQPELLWATNRRKAHFVTFSTRWEQYPGSVLSNYPSLDPNELYWRIASKEITLSNLKPQFKIDAGKKVGSVEYTIEKFEGTFYYDPLIGDYALCNTKKPQTVGVSFTAEPSKGTIDIGSTKTIKIDSIHPVKEFWQQCYRSWEKVKKHAQSLPTPHKLETPTSDWDILSYVKPSEDDLAVAYKNVARDSEEFKPEFVEEVFKITFKGGYRVAEPRGPQPVQDCRVFYLKIKALVP